MSLRIGTVLVALAGLALFTMSLATDVSELAVQPDRYDGPRYTSYLMAGDAVVDPGDPELQLLVIREVAEPAASESPWFDGTGITPFVPAAAAMFRASIDDNSQHSTKEAGI